MAAKRLDHMAIQAAKERSLIDAKALMQDKEFASLEEANAYLQTVVKEGGPPPAPADTPLKQAQQIAYDAMGATGSRRVMLARRALEISPDCADAWSMLAADEAKSLKRALRYARKGVAAGKRALGEKFFEEEVGNFWSIVEARPYMRALMILAELLWVAEKADEAMELYQEMLRLNPDDNQGARYAIMKHFVEANRDDLAEALLDKSKGDPTATVAYTRALWLFRKEGASPAADAALDDALKKNPFVPQYLLGERVRPSRMPEHYALGDQNEAITYVITADEGWIRTEGARTWLMVRFQKMRGIR